jgi:hypothetical protein
LEEPLLMIFRHGQLGVELDLEEDLLLMSAMAMGGKRCGAGGDR